MDIASNCTPQHNYWPHHAVDAYIALRLVFAPMNIYLNGEAREVPDNCSAAELVEQLGLGGKRIAMELNREIVPRSSYGDTPLKADDKVEIVHAIGGG